MSLESMDSNFESLGIKGELVSALSEIGIKEPTQIQVKAIPSIIAGNDVVGLSETGSGKTAAFGLPLLQRIEPNAGLQTLIIAPTRELAVQIAGELKKFSKYKRVFISAVYGGVSLGPQINSISRSHIVVGTPGRLKDHLQRGTLDLSKIKSVVLDEADKMVEMGFVEDIEDILNSTPGDRQMLLFGATISREIDGIKRKYMNNPQIAGVESKVEFLQQYYYTVEMNEKFSLLTHLLKKSEVGKSIVFCSTIHTVEAVAKNLRTQGIKCDMLHGKLSQNRRLRVIETFHKDYFDVLVASAVAARGLDIKNISHVFNYDLSKDPQEYVHRVGRTARAGESGKAITLLSPRDYDAFRNVLDKFRMDVQELEKENFERIAFRIERNGFNNKFGRHGYQRNRFGNNGFGSNRPRGNNGNGYSGNNGFGSNRPRGNGVSEYNGNNFRGRR